MSRRADPGESFRSTVAEAFAFLVEDAGFCGPEPTKHGLGFHRPGLLVEVWFLPGREAEVATWVQRSGADGATTQSAWLECLYVAAGCGPAQHVPGAAPTLRAVLKRVGEHAVALRRLLPFLLTSEAEDLFVRCPPSRHLPTA
ncbi:MULTISPECIES: hypothetical protein [unclassified Streptomyces]|uniref:hypothetical protein n=1 Tax=unclassified Streptomyces TaxID=2593676 RepID=UPI002DDC5A0E|nr:hypothetical protein [Streptomyces sp. NBC_01445]WSE02225.1 hypothetical protein OG574_01615 [Streptomyces sp. NBC_01445]